MELSLSELKPRILVFDSGFGGLSIFDELRNALPRADYIYVTDHKFAPYGSRGILELRRRIPQILATFKHADPHIIVVACNTASTIALQELRREFTIPIVGVVPAIKPAATLSKSKVIGLIATPATINGDYLAELVQTFARDTIIIPCASVALVSLVEAKMRGEVIELQAIREALKPLLEHADFERMDTVVLGCTHFPFISQELAHIVGSQHSWIDSSAAIVRRVVSLLNQMSLPLDYGVSVSKAFICHQSEVSESLKMPFLLRNFDSITTYEV